MISPIIRNVALATAEQSKNTTGSCRRGTCYTGLHKFASRFGNPHESNFSENGLDGAGKVHAIWYVATPRGVVAIRDYWWNGAEEMSIAADNRKAALWCRAWLRNHGVSCK